jgi:hypothetical protein
MLRSKLAPIAVMMLLSVGFVAFRPLWIAVRLRP